MPDSTIGGHQPVRLGPAHQHEPAEHAPRRLAGWTGSVLAIALGTAFLAWRLQTGFFIWNDDLLEFSVARTYGFSSELLFFNLFQHFAPINRFLHLAALDLFALNPSAMAWVSVAIAFILLCTVAWLATELGLSPLRRTLALVLVAGSIVLVDTLAWMDGGWHGITALVATYLVIAMHVRALRTNQQRWHVLSVLVFLIGLLTQERAAFALPMLILVDLFLLNQGDPFRDRLRNALRVRWPLAVMALASVALAVLLKLEYVVEGSGVTPVPLVAKTALAALTNQLFPQLLGFVPDPWPLPIQLGVLLALVAGACWLCRLNRQNTGPIIFVAASFTLYWGFLIVSPFLIEANWTGQSQRYAFYTLVPLALAISSLRGGREARRWFTMPARSRRVLAHAGVVVVALLLLGTQWRYTSGARWDPNRESHDYLQNIADSRPTWTNPAITIIPTQAPKTVAVDWAAGLGRGEFVLALAAPHWRPGDLTGSVVSFDDRGHLQQTDLQVVAHGHPIAPALYPDSTQTQGSATCLAPSTGGDALRFALDRPVRDTNALIRLSYSSTVGGTVTVVTLAGDRYQWDDWPNPITAGEHTTLLPTSTQLINPADAVQLAKVPTGATFCVRAIDIVIPVVRQPDGSCTLMDRYGRATQAVQCPTP